MRSAGLAVLAVLSLAVVGYAIGAYTLLPAGAAVHPGMRSAFEAHRVGLYVHVFASAVALALGPFQFSSALRSARPGLHRWLGRLYLGVGVLAGGLAGLYMALHAYGGVPGRLGFACLALAWLFTGLRAYLAVRAGKLAAHRCWMVRNFALTFAAVTLRLWLPASLVAGVSFDLAYPLIAWFCWVPNLVAAELLFNAVRQPVTAREGPATGR